MNETIYSALNDQRYIVGLFVDLKKAYETVNHQDLLRKLHGYGVRGIAYEWFRNYLTGRKHRVKIGDTLSDLTEISVGIPQGSVLGTLLFLIYINDLPKISTVFHTVLFADDTCFTLAGDNFDDLIATFNNELNIFSNWLIINRLTINHEKTVAINFSLKKAFNINVNMLRINNHQLNYVESTKYLGIMLDKNLTFREHIEYICNRISKSIGIMFRLSVCTPENVLRSLYNSLISPYLMYCNLIWGNAADVHLNRLLMLQKRALRIITFSEYLAHTEELFKQLNIPKIHDIHKYSCCLYVFSNKNKFEINDDVYSTRNCNSFKVKFQRFEEC